MDHCNGLQTHNKFEAPLGTDTHCYEAKRDWPNPYDSVIEIILYLTSNTRPDIYFAVHKCSRFTHKIRVSHEMSVKRICWYLQGTKDKGLLLNKYTKLTMGFNADAGFAGLWGHENTQYPICAKSRTECVVTFSSFPLLCVSKLHTYIYLATLHSEYVELSHSIRDSLPLKSLIKELIKNWELIVRS